MKKKFYWIALILVAALFSWQVIARIQSRNKSGDKPGGNRGLMDVAVETIPLKMMDISDIGTFSGNLIAQSSFMLAPRVSGQLKKLHVEIGQTIKRGHLVAELDDQVYLQELEKAKANVAVARAQAELAATTLELAEVEFTNQSELFNKGFIARSDFDQAKAELASDRAKHKVAVASLNNVLASQNTAELQLSYTKIKAEWESGPSTRIVGERFVDEGSFVSSGSPLLKVIDIKSVIAVIDVIETDYTRVQTKQKVKVTTDAYPTQSFTGSIVRKSPLLSESSRQARVEIEIPNPEQLLKPGMFVRVFVTYETRKEVQVVPLATLINYNGKEGVFIVSAGADTASFVPLEIGIRGMEYVEVLSPQLEGEVVSLGQDLLEDGSKISLASKEKKNNKKGKRDRG